MVKVSRLLDVLASAVLTVFSAYVIALGAIASVRTLLYLMSGDVSTSVVYIFSGVMFFLSGAFFLFLGRLYWRGEG